MAEFNHTTVVGRTYLQGFGGDTSNFAVSAARQARRRLSVRARHTSTAQCAPMWRAEGIDDSGVATDADAFTAVYFVTHDAAAIASYFRSGSAPSHAPDQLPRKAIAAARVLHVSGISLAISETARATCFAAMRAAHDAGALVSFDTNFRAQLWPIATARAVIDEAIALSDICLPSHDDLAALTALEEPDALIDHCLGRGARIVALQNGARGLWVAERARRLRIRRTRAGRSFRRRCRRRVGRGLLRRQRRPRRPRQRRTLRRVDGGALDRRFRRRRADSACCTSARSARAQRRAHFSATALRLARPVSKSLPIILSMLVNKPISFIMKVAGPRIVHCTSVASPRGASVNSVTLWPSNGRMKSS
jgi:2-dehydro-3-deoxygluconokinase